MSVDPLSTPIRLATLAGAEVLREGQQIIEAYDVHHVPGDVWVAGEGTLHRRVRIPASGRFSA